MLDLSVPPSLPVPRHWGRPLSDLSSFSPPTTCNGLWPLRPPVKAVQGRGVGRGRSPRPLAGLALARRSFV